MQNAPWENRWLVSNGDFTYEERCLIEPLRIEITVQGQLSDTERFAVFLAGLLTCTFVSICSFVIATGLAIGWRPQDLQVSVVAGATFGFGLGVVVGALAAHCDERSEILSVISLGAMLPAAFAAVIFYYSYPTMFSV